MEAATLFHNLAPVFGAELCMQVVLPLVVKLAEDSVFRVRKAIAANMGNVSLFPVLFSPVPRVYAPNLNVDATRYVVQLVSKPQHSTSFLYLLH